MTTEYSSIRLQAEIETTFGPAFEGRLSGWEVVAQAVLTLNAAVSKQEEYCCSAFLCVESGDLTLRWCHLDSGLVFPQLNLVGNILLDAEVCFHGDSKSIQIVNEG